jgi:hypothetical protein
LNTSASSPESIARALAEVFTSGDWTIDAMVDRGASILGRRMRWIRPLARRVLAAFNPERRPRAEPVFVFIRNDHRFLEACERHRPELHYGRWPPAQMGLVSGPPSTWKVPPLANATDLAALLQIDTGHLDWFADPSGLLAKAIDEPLRHYRFEWRTKRSGKPRLIEAPKPRLKKIQRQLLTEILDRIPPHEAAHGFRKGRSILSFTRGHVGRNVILKMDLRDFFASITASRVESIFLTAGYPEKVARLLTGLCTSLAPRHVLAAVQCRGTNTGSTVREIKLLYGRRHLPQGAPTSPAIANLCAFRLDSRLSGLSQAAGGIYTRYADDLIFSGDDAFARHIRTFASHVAAIALEEGFFIQHRKTRLMRQGVRQRVAGIVVNNRLNVPRVEFDRIKAILFNCLQYGAESQNRESVGDFRAHLAGKIAYVSAINPDRGRRLKETFDRVVW